MKTNTHKRSKLYAHSLVLTLICIKHRVLLWVIMIEDVFEQSLCSVCSHFHHINFLIQVTIIFRHDSYCMMWHSLPEELLLQLFSYLKHGEIISVSKTCKRWNQVGRDDILWKRLIRRDFKIPESRSRSRVVKGKGLQNEVLYKKTHNSSRI